MNLNNQDEAIDLSSPSKRKSEDDTFVPLRPLVVPQKRPSPGNRHYAPILPSVMPPPSSKRSCYENGSYMQIQPAIMQSSPSTTLNPENGHYAPMHPAIMPASPSERLRQEKGPYMPMQQVVVPQLSQYNLISANVVLANAVAALLAKQQSGPSETPAEVIDVDESKGFPCELCNKILPTRAGFKRHLYYHNKSSIDSDSFEYKCHLCTAGFRYRTSLDYHLVGHDLDGSERLGNGQYKCSDCDTVFDHLKSLKRHRMKKSPNFSCNGQ